MTAGLFSPLPLRSGAVLENRIAKAAMEENLAGAGQLPDERLVELYRRWSAGGAGLLITGNVMVHAEALTGPAGVVLDETTPLEPFARWASAARSGGSAVWMQINHPGRQVEADMPGVVWGPSAVGVDLGRQSRRFGSPTAMTADQIDATVRRFAVTAARAEQAGFDGVEVHAAHGYLLSQFLTPLVNDRTDDYGGSLEKRARMLLDAVRAIREAVSREFAVAVKLNSADFQRGGFDADDARRVIAWLEPLGVDLVELSGGSYESPAMTGRPADRRTRAREAYFLDLAEDLATTSPLPLMLTGGITRRATAEDVVAGGVALVGIGTALAVTPDLPRRWRDGRGADRAFRPVTWSNKPLASAASMAQVRRELRRLARGADARPGAHPAYALAAEQLTRRRALRRYRTWLAARPVGVVARRTSDDLGPVRRHRRRPLDPEGGHGPPLRLLGRGARRAPQDLHDGRLGDHHRHPGRGGAHAGPAQHVPDRRPSRQAAEVAAYLGSIEDELAAPRALDEVDETGFDIVFYPGGHGPMEDLADDPVSGGLLTRRLASGKPLALLCHAPAASLAAANDDGSWPFAGYRMTGLSNAEERLDPFAWKAPWFLEDRLTEKGADYSKALLPLRPHVVVDLNLYTGQNPFSSEKLAERIVADAG